MKFTHSNLALSCNMMHLVNNSKSAKAFAEHIFITYGVNAEVVNKFYVKLDLSQEQQNIIDIEINHLLCEAIECFVMSCNIIIHLRV